MPPGPLVIAHHLIWTAYGCWLPNDPRGSSSHTVTSDIMKRLGEFHPGRKRVQPASSDIRDFYAVADEWLRHDRLTFDPRAIEVIARAFAETIECERYTCYACAIMPDHLHLLIRKHKHAAEQMIAHSNQAARGFAKPTSAPPTTLPGAAPAGRCSSTTPMT